MAKKTKRDQTDFRCSFCNKSQAEVRRLIAGPTDTYICDECVGVCKEILTEEGHKIGWDHIMAQLTSQMTRIEELEDCIKQIKDSLCEVIDLAGSIIGSRKSTEKTVDQSTN